MISIHNFNLPSNKEELFLALLDKDKFLANLAEAYEISTKEWRTYRKCPEFNKMERDFASLIVFYLKETKNTFIVPEDWDREEKFGTYIEIFGKSTNGATFCMTFWVDHEPDSQIIKYVSSIIGNP